MATATMVVDLIEITDCDSTSAGGSWSGIAAALDTEDPDPIEGTGWIGGVVKQADDSNTMTFTPTSSINMVGKHLRLLFNTILKPNLKTQADGGIQIVLNGTATFNVSGGDTYVGGWEVLMVDPYANPDEGSAITGNVSSILINFKLKAAAKNIVTINWDWFSYGNGFYAYGGTSGDEIGFVELDAQDVYYKLIEKIKGVYQLTGKVQIGDSTGSNSTYFKDAGRVLIFQDLYSNASLYEIVVAGNATGTTSVNLSGNFFTSVGRPWAMDFTDETYVDEVILNGTIIQNAVDVFGSSIVEGEGTVFDACGMLELEDATFNSIAIKNGDEAAALLLISGHNLTTVAFTSAGTGHAILIETAGTYNITGFTYSGYASVDGSTGNECIYNNSGGAVTINVTGGGTPTIRNGSGATTTVVAGAVTVNVIAQTATGTKIESARVFLAIADATGSFPFEESVTIVNSGTTATVTHTGHGLATSDKVFIKGASLTANNGVFTITVTDVNTYTYTMTSTPGSSPTGTITSTFVVLSGLTAATTGLISMSRVFSSNENVVGWARKSTSAPYYKEGPLSATISSSTGASLTAILSLDQ